MSISVMSSTRDHGALGSARLLDDGRRWTLAARGLVVAALILEIQMPRVNDFRLNLIIFVALMYGLLLHRFRSVARNLHVIMLWPLVALTAYCAWAFASFAWSPTPVESAAQAVILVGALLLTVSYSEIPTIHLAREFVRITTLLASASWILLVLIPGAAVRPDVTWRLNGVMVHEQRLALAVGAAIILGVTLRVGGHRVFKSPGCDSLAMILLGTTLLATQTRANTVYVLIVVGAIIYARAHVAVKVLLLTALTTFIGWLVLNFDWVMGVLDREGSNTATLTGRTSIWQGSLAMLPDHLWEGYGFGSFYSPLTAHFFTNYIAPHAHNTWINSLFETGVVGATLLSLFLLGGLFAGGASKSYSYAWPTVLFVSLCGTTGIVFGEKISTLWVITVAMVAQAAWQRKSEAPLNRPGQRSVKRVAARPSRTSGFTMFSPNVKPRGAHQTSNLKNGLTR